MFKRGWVWWVSRSFSKVSKKAGIENLGFHDLRHDFCSRLVQRGVDLYTVATLAGHKDIKMTQRYSHLCPENLRSAINVLNPGYILATVEKIIDVRKRQVIDSESVAGVAQR